MNSDNRARRCLHPVDIGDPGGLVQCLAPATHVEQMPDQCQRFVCAAHLTTAWPHIALADFFEAVDADRAARILGTP